VTQELRALVLTAASIGFFHTLFGPDHYLPFIMMSWARQWSAGKTALITLICAVGHIASSVVLGLIGVFFGLALKGLVGTESVRGGLAAWLLTAFGLAYFVWGIRLVYRRHPHQHRHPHLSDAEHPHQHVHTHLGEHAHVHDKESAKTVTPWVLFVIFVFGPCEPLIPLLMYPAAESGTVDLLIVTAVFGIVTTSTMLAAVLLGRSGVDFLPLKKVQRYSHALAGASILLCGLAILFLGL
jgi:nickel/cobalt transporter (NicO) family protein